MLIILFPERRNGLLHTREPHIGIKRVLTHCPKQLPCHNPTQSITWQVVDLLRQFLTNTGRDYGAMH